MSDHEGKRLSLEERIKKDAHSMTRPDALSILQNPASLKVIAEITEKTVQELSELLRSEPIPEGEGEMLFGALSIEYWANADIEEEKPNFLQISAALLKLIPKPE